MKTCSGGVNEVWTFISDDGAREGWMRLNAMEAKWEWGVVEGGKQIARGATDTARGARWHLQHVLDPATA